MKLFKRKKIVSFILCFALILGMFVPYYVEANEKITIDLKRNPKIDIVVTANETIVNMTNFKEDLFAELETNHGIDSTNINVETIARAEVSSNAADASTIFNDWGRIGYT